MITLFSEDRFPVLPWKVNVCHNLKSHTKHELFLKRTGRMMCFASTWVTSRNRWWRTVMTAQLLNPPGWDSSSHWRILKSMFTISASLVIWIFYIFGPSCRKQSRSDENDLLSKRKNEWANLINLVIIVYHLFWKT